MRTTEEVVAYLEVELAEATKMHEQAKGNNAQEAVFYLIRLNTIMHLLENIKDEEQKEY